MEETRQISTGYLIKRFAPYFKKYRWVLVLDLFCAALTTICELVLPLIVRFITDKGMNDMASLSVKLILYVGLFYLILSALSEDLKMTFMPVFIIDLFIYFFDIM